MTRDARGNVTRTDYDASNRVSSVTTPSGLVTSTAYAVSYSGGAYTNRMTVTAPHAVGQTGVQAITDYDVAGRKVREDTSATLPTDYSYDVRGNVLSVTKHVPEGDGDLKTTSEYNGFGEAKVTSSEKSGGGWAASYYTFDADGRLSKVDGPRGDVNDWVEYSYDNLDRLTEARLTGFATPAIFGFSYDDAGERTKAVAPLESGTMVRKWTYDTSGRLKTEEVGNRKTTNDYDVAGRLLTATLRNLQSQTDEITKTFTYDRLGHQLTRAATNSPSATMTYDAAGNLLSAAEGGRIVSMEYDSDNRLCAVTLAASDGNCATGDTRYTFDQATGWLRSAVDAAGTTRLGYATATGQITAVDDPLSSASQPQDLDNLPYADSSELTLYAYDTAGRLTGRKDPAGATWVRTYEANTGRVNTQAITKGGKTLGSFDLDYDEAGNVTTRVEQVLDSSDPNANLAGSGTWTYGYDAANRMSWAQAPGAGGAKTSYTYDGAGNRTGVQVGNGPVQTTTYSAAGLPLGSGQTTYGHDLAGDLTQINAPVAANDRSFGYDAWGRVTATCAAEAMATDCAGRVAYGYDALSRTVTRTTGVAPSTTTSNFTYRGIGEDVVQIDALKIAQGPFGPLAQGSVGSASFYLKDLHSDVVGLYSTASVGNSGSKLYSPWGEKTASTGASTDLGYQSDWTDPASGQVDMGTRYYEPTMGRFSTQDVLFGEMTNPNTLNQYIYGADSPLTFSDPTGMKPVDGSWQDHNSKGNSYTQTIHNAGGGTQGTEVGSDGYGATSAPVFVPPTPKFPEGSPLAQAHPSRSSTWRHETRSAFDTMMDQMDWTWMEAGQACGGDGGCTTRMWVDAVAFRYAGITSFGVTLFLPEGRPFAAHRTDPPFEILGNSGWKKGFVDDESPARHFLGWMALAYHHPTQARLALSLAESQGRGGTWQDIWAGHEAISIGTDLKMGFITVPEAMSETRAILGDPSQPAWAATGDGTGY